jgi:hypothetical protein
MLTAPARGVKVMRMDHVSLWGWDDRDCAVEDRRQVFGFVCRVATCEAEGEEQDAGGFADEREARIEARQIACAYCGGKLQARPYA